MEIHKVYDVEHGWYTPPLEPVEFSNEVIWYLGDNEEGAAIHIQLAEGMPLSVYAQVTVWAFGTGTVYYAADPGSLVALVGMFTPGVSWMKDKHLKVIEVAE